MATSSLSVGTNNRDSKELKHLQDALRWVDSLLHQKARDDFEFVTAANSLHGKRGDVGEHGGGSEDGGSSEGEAYEKRL